MTTTDRLPAHAVTEKLVFSKLQFLSDFSVWPGRSDLDPDGWLDNFRPVERPFAVNILNVFLYFAEHLVDSLFHAAIHSLSSVVTADSRGVREARHVWKTFLSNALFTYVQGEDPSPTDSGHLFVRKARQVVGIRDEHIVDPIDALRCLIDCPDRPIVFVDDFVGSGNQMTCTWFKDHEMGGLANTSFARCEGERQLMYYVPLVATTFGLNEIQSRCRGLYVNPAHTIDERYSLVSPETILWPENLKDNSAEMLFEASRRAGIVDGYEWGWKGFCDLALAIAFSHSVPDATLPLLFWERNGWHPLIRRR